MRPVHRRGARHQRAVDRDLRAGDEPAGAAARLWRHSRRDGRARIGARPDRRGGAAAGRRAAGRRSGCDRAAVRPALPYGERGRLSGPDDLPDAGHGGSADPDRPAQHAAERLRRAQGPRLGLAAGRLHGADHPGLRGLRQISGDQAASRRAAGADPGLGKPPVAAQSDDPVGQSARPGSGRRQCAFQPRQGGARAAGHQPVPLRARRHCRRRRDRRRAGGGGRAARRPG